MVIVGGGFGGLYAATYLGRSEFGENGLEVILVDRQNYFTFTPLLAEVATGTFGREHVTHPYRVLARRFGFRFVQDAVCRIDLERKIVRTPRSRLSYDYLVIATGAAPRFFGNEAIKRSSVPLTSVSDALSVRARVVDALERADVTTDVSERKRLSRTGGFVSFEATGNRRAAQYTDCRRETWCCHGRAPGRNGGCHPVEYAGVDGRYGSRQVVGGSGRAARRPGRSG